MTATRDTPPPATSSEVLVLEQLLRGRWTCRQFLPDQVPRSTIEQLLELAQRTPSWCNTQPWQVAITEADGTTKFRQQLRAYIEAGKPGGSDFPFPVDYPEPLRGRRKDCAIALYDSVGIAKGDKAASFQQTLRNFEFFDAPHVAIVTSHAALGTYGAVDTGLYISNFLLAAQALGLGAAPQAAVATYAPMLREHFSLPEHQLVVAGISFGYPDLDHPVNQFRTSRESLDGVVSWH